MREASAVACHSENLIDRKQSAISIIGSQVVFKNSYQSNTTMGAYRALWACVRSIWSVRDASHVARTLDCLVGVGWNDSDPCLIVPLIVDGVRPLLALPDVVLGW